MKSFRTIGLLAVMMLAFGISAMAQTTLISPTGDGGFENGADFPSNGWTVVNGTANQLFVGPTAGPSAGTNSAFSGTNSTTWTGQAVSSVNHFYRDIAFPSGEGAITLSFKYKVNAPDPNFDFLRVFLVPTTTTPVAGTQLTSGQIGGTYDSATSYATITIIVPASAAGTTQRLVFSWRTDGITPHAAVSVDEISLVSQVQVPVVGTKTIDNTQPTGGNNFASFTAAINALNLNGTGAGGVTFNVTAGQSFAETPSCITLEGTTANQIIFQRSGAGANPAITPTGTATANEAGVCIQGGDFITFDGVDVAIVSGALEYGYRVVNASATNGATNNTVRNTSITLLRTNLSSYGILQSTTTTGGGVAPTAASGANSNNKYYNLTIRNVFSGIYILGTAAFPDSGTEIGTTTPNTFNTIGDPATPNDIGNITSTVWGIRVAGQNAIRVFNNAVQNVTHTGTATATGIYFDNAGTGTLGTSLVYNNKVSNISRITSTSATGNIYGIRADISTGNAVTVYNNFITGLSFSNPATATANISMRAFGANVGGNAGTVNAYFNSVRADQGANLLYGSAAYYLAGGSTVTQNNIFSNFTGAQTGVAKHYAYYRAAGTITTSTNNDLYIASGTGAATNGFTGFFTSDRATLADFQAVQAGLETNSIVADPQFISAADLHVAADSPLVDAGVAAGGIAQDIDGQNRVGTPDIGADEPGGVTPPANDIAAASIVAPANGTIFGTGATTTPQATFTNFGTATQTNVQVTFTITGPGGYNCTNTQTIATITPNQTVTVTFAACPAFTTAGTYTTTATVTTPDANAANNTVMGAFTVLAPVPGGTVNVGTGETFTSLTNPGGLFAALNAAGATGNIVINITTDLTGETGANAMNELAGGLTATIQPSGAARTISGTSAAGLVPFSGTDNVTINGSLTSTGFDRSLTINNAGAGGGITFSTGNNGAQNNTIRYVNVFGNSPTTTIIGIAFQGNTFGSAGADNDNNRIIACDIRSSIFGIYSIGASAANPNTGVLISGNLMNSTGAARIGRVGIFTGNDDGVQIIGNNIGGMVNAEAADVIAIAAGSQTLAEAAPATISQVNAVISRNYIGLVQQTNTFSAAGIVLGSGVTGTNRVDNNMITGVIANSNLGDVVAGIYVVPAAGATQNIYYNSVSMTGDRTAGTNQFPSYALAITADQPVNVQNNILVNSQIRGASTSLGGESFAIAFGGPAANVNLFSNNNDLFVSGALGNIGLTGDLSSTVQAGTAGTGVVQPALADWQAATGEDGSSISQDPLWVSTTDLHIQATSPVQDLGVPIAAVPRDFDSQLRAQPSLGIGTTDLGADELAAPTAASATISGRVMTADGRGIRNVRMTLTLADGSTRTILTGPFGNYRFTEISAGQSVILSVYSKRFSFEKPTRVFDVVNEANEINFISLNDSMSKQAEQ